MPGFTFTDEDVPQFELLPKGKYRYRVIGVEFGMQNSGKTNGCAKAELKLRWFNDKEEPVAQWTENLTFPETRDQSLNLFLTGILNMFVKSSNLLIEGQPPKPNQPVDFTEEMLMGLQGWAMVGQIPRRDKPDEKYNNVDRWLTDQPKLDKHVETPAEPAEENPFS